MRRDPVTKEIAELVLERDAGCVGPRIWMPGLCRGRIEIDHVANLGLSLRGPSKPENLVSLCTYHHRMKTEAGLVWRPILLAYLYRWSSSNGAGTPTEWSEDARGSGGSHA
jgi:hypothetical protein